MSRLLRQAASVSLMLIVIFAIFSYPVGIFPVEVPIRIPNANAVSRSIFLDGTFFGWNNTTPNPNPSITVARGDTINLSLHSGDTQHLFYIDIDGDGAAVCPQEKCSSDFGGVFPPDTSIPIDVDFAPGIYTYYCPYHQPTMFGDFIVQGFRITSSPSSLRVVQGFSNMSTVAVTSVNSFAGIVDLSTTVSPVLPVGPAPVLNPTSLTLPADQTQFSTLTVSTSSSTPGGNYIVNVTGTSGSAYFNQIVPVLVVPPDFGINANPARLVIPLGATKNSTITLSSLDSFSGDVALSLSPDPLPTGMIANLTPSSVTLTSGGRANSTLNVSISPTFAQPGTYMVNVTGTGGSQVHITIVTVVAGPDFDLATSPITLSLTPGTSDTSTITLTSFNEFAGTVDLTGIVSPGGPEFSFSSQIVPLSAGGTAIALLRVNASATIVASNYTVTVYAASGLLNHSSPVSVSVRDFGLAVSIANLTVQQGSPATVTLSLRSLNGFAGIVSLTTTASSSDLSLLLNVTTITFDVSGIEFAVLTINASSVQAGTYTVSITGTSGSLVRTVSLGVSVQPAPGEASILPLIGGVAVSAIAIATAGLYFTKRRRLREKTPGSQIPT